MLVLRYVAVKKIDKLILSGFLGPYLMSFFVAEFVLLMQFLWKNIDEILGKGFSLFELLELIFYFGVTIIPLSVPITILIASVMVFGNLSERYELSSLKSAGIPLTRIMRSGFVLACLTGLFSLLASNYLKPKANFKFEQRFKAIQKSKPSLSLEEGVFDDDFKGYVIRIGKKDPDGRNIKDILMYDQENMAAYMAHITKAEKGEMYTTPDGNLFIMSLENGEQLKELDRSNSKKKKGGKYPLMRTYFKNYKKVFDMSQFDVNEDNANINRKKKEMMNSFQLLAAVDTVDVQKIKVRQKLRKNFDGLIDIKVDSQRTIAKIAEIDAQLEMSDMVKKYRSSSKITKNKVRRSMLKTKVKQFQKDSLQIDTIQRFASTILPRELKNLVSRTNNAASNTRDVLRSRISKLSGLERTKSRYLYTLNQQYVWAVACIVFLFIGAPLGSIIRKGGYGFPLLFSIIFYMLLFVSTIMGNKLNKNGTLGPYLAAWLPILLLLPFAITITSKALRDKKFSFSISMPKWLKRLFRVKSKEVESQ